jgi:Myb-like DNA-binding protein BAS1
MDPSIDRVNGRAGKCTAGEDSKLKDAERTHGDKNWGLIAALVPGRTQKQCYKRWNDVLDPSIGRESGRSSNWTAVEDSKLKDAVLMHGDKDWGAISALIPSRTRNQCCERWHDAFDPNIDRTSGRTC